MKLRSVLLLLVFSLMLSLIPIRPSINIKDLITPQIVSLAQAQEVHQQSKGFFTENKGQWNSKVLFVGKTSFGKIIIAQDAVYYQLLQSKTIYSGSTEDHAGQYLNMGSKHIQTVKLSFENSVTPTINGLNILPHYHNYFIGNDSSTWASHCRNFTQVFYENVWEGIDLSYFFTAEGLKYEFYVKPSANIHDLKIRVEGANLINHGHQLELSTSLGSIVDDQLSVFTQDTKTNINATFSTKGNIISFLLDNVERNETIVIDPLVYATYLGGLDEDRPDAIVVDALGQAYITGYTLSADFPISIIEGGFIAPAYDHTHNGDIDVFLSKLNPAGTQLVFCTFLGGNESDFAKGITLDSAGNIYLTGFTNSPNFPTFVRDDGTNLPAPSYYNLYNGCGTYDTFVVKLNNAGTELRYSTYLGGCNNDSAFAIAVDSLGQAYVAGHTTSADFPVGVTFGGPPAPGYNQTHNAKNDVFVVKLNSLGTELVYSTFLGGNEDDFAYGIALDNMGHAYVTGFTKSPTTFPMSVTPGGLPAPGYDKTHNGDADAYVFKLNSAGTELLYATFLGGSQEEHGKAIAINNAGQVAITGWTLSVDYPMSTTVGGPPAPGYDKTHNGNTDVFVTMLNAWGTELLFSTFLGGINTDRGYGIALDAIGQIYVTGMSYSDNIPLTKTNEGTELAMGYDQSRSGGSDALLFKLNPSGTQLLYASYFGGHMFEAANAIALDPWGYVYITGETISDDFSMTITKNGAQNAPGYDQTYNDNDDAFVLKIKTFTGEVSPIAPYLLIDAEVSRPTFSKNEEAMIMLTVINQGGAVATDTIVTMTLPKELTFIRATRYRSKVLTPAIVEFELGAIAAYAVQTFQIDAKVNLAVVQEKTIPIFFDVNCEEKSWDDARVMINLVPRRTAPPDLYLGLYYRNVQWDPQTNSIFINKGTLLEIDLHIIGAQLPYQLNLEWGDGNSKNEDHQTSIRRNLSHTYNTAGVKKIVVTVTDQMGRTKSASLSIEVR